MPTVAQCPKLTCHSSYALISKRAIRKRRGFGEYLRDDWLYAKYTSDRLNITYSECNMRRDIASGTSACSGGRMPTRRHDPTDEELEERVHGRRRRWRQRSRSSSLTWWAAQNLSNGQTSPHLKPFRSPRCRELPGTADGFDQVHVSSRVETARPDVASSPTSRLPSLPVTSDSIRSSALRSLAIVVAGTLPRSTLARMSPSIRPRNP